MWFNQYPYINLTDLNLDFLYKSIKELRYQLENFISINAIKYANPIQWNITTQYEAHTVVIDANDGTAYLSVKAVPSGVAITNTDYWTPIFTLNLLSANQNITMRDDGSNVLATFSSVAGDWLIWNNTLYKVSQNINVNEAYVVGYNLDRYSVELFIKDYINAIETMIGDLNDLTTTDKDSIVDAINEMVAAVGTLTTNIGDLNDLDTTDKTSIVNAINEALTGGLSVTPEQFGAVGDGVTDDTTAFQNAIDYAITNKCSVIATRTYNVHGLVVSSTIYDGITIIFNQLYSNNALPVLTLEGQSIKLFGNIIINDGGDGLQCGGDNYGYAGGTVTVNFIKSTVASCLVLKAHSTGNVQDNVFNITRMLYKVHAVKMDTTSRYVGEITFNGTWFNSLDMADNAFAIWCDCANYGMTGLYLNSCSFEGAGGGIKVLNTSPNVQHQFMPLNGFGLRVSELTEQYNKTFIDYHGDGRLIGTLFVDSLPLDKVIINNSLSATISACKFTIYGRLRTKTGEAVFTNKAILTEDGMAFNIVDDCLMSYNVGATTYTDTLPYSAHIRNQSTIAFSFSTFRFTGEIWITCDNSTCIVTVNGTTFTPTTAGEVIKIKCVYLVGVGYRYLVEQGGKVTIKTPMP